MPNAVPEAIIAHPASGTVVQGIVAIHGSAFHPEFQRYDLYFTRDPGEDWVFMGEAEHNQVITGQLGTWNTTSLSNGAYSLRLRVVRQDGNYDEGFVRNIVVDNAPNLPTDAPLPSAGTPSSATATLAPTMSPTPLVADTPSALPGRTSTRPGATPTSARSGGTATPGAVGSIPAPRLAAPPDGELVTANQSVAFTWDWDGRLGANQGFEVRIWREGAADHPGAAPPVQGMSQSIRVSGTSGVQGEDGEYLWTVALVQVDPYRRIGAEAPVRRLTYRSSAGPVDTPVPTATPLPPPPPPVPTATPLPPPPPPTP